MKKIFCTTLFTVLLVATSCKNEEQADQMEKADAMETLSTAQKVAQKAGIDNWSEVKSIDFTFNVDRNGETLSKRSWKWQPKTDQVTLISKNETISYHRNMALDSLALSADRAFINDSYWLLPQFKLIWDEGTTITYPDEKTITIAYGNQGGYTPGDRYDLTINDDYKVTSWDYYPAGKREPAMTTSFENYQNFNGLVIAQEHKNEDGSLNIRFSDIAVDRE